MRRHTLLIPLGLVCSLALLPGCGRARPVDEILADGDERVDDLPRVEVAEGDWPWWRGPTRDGHAFEGQDPPLVWSEEENVLWKVAVPGRGHASPTIWGERIFVATADEAAEKQLLVCYDRASGEKRWETALHEGKFTARHAKNSHASPTPACDGEHVFLPLLNDGALWLSAVDLEGNIAWQKRLGDFSVEHGYGSSPVIYRSLVIASADTDGGAFLAAVNRETGDLVWQVPREKNINSYATPIVAHVAGRDQLLLHGAGEVSSYDPASGQRIWYCEGPSKVGASTVAAGEEMVYASGGYPEQNLLCIRADGEGDVTETHIEWQSISSSQVAYVPSPLLDGEYLYVVDDGGIATCFDAATGQRIWRERLRGDFTASPILAGGHIYAANEQGTTYVFKPGPEAELVAANELNAGAYASPAIVEGRIYLRTLDSLYCLGESSPAEGGENKKEE